MGNYPAPPASGLQMDWDSPDGGTVAKAALRWENEAWTFEVVLEVERATVAMRVSAGWSVQQMLLFRDLPEPDLWLATDGGGRWGEVNGAHRTDLDGATDIVVADCSVFRGVALRRLPLRIGDAAEMREITLDVETLALDTAVTRYLRLDSHVWRIERLRDGRVAELTVDEFGFVVDDPGRLARGRRG